MDRERFLRVEQIFQRALAVPGEQRAELVARECGTDQELLREVHRLLAGDARADQGIERFELFRGRDDPLLGKQVGAWRILERMAEGGMGVVYRAERGDGLYEQQVAVKLLRVEAASEDALRRFDLERRVLARLVHPHIARMLDGGHSEQGTPFIVMEFIDGLPIDRWCDEHGLSLERRLRLFAAVCRAVHFAHQNLVVHRDLKPSNVMVDRNGEPKLLDFGIARLVGDEAVLTQTGPRPLTPQYASPEQLQGLPLTTATDVYSLGVVLYEVLTGRRPWRRTGRSPAEWERIVTMEPPTRPSTAVRPRERQQGATTLAFAARMHTTPARLHRRLRGDLDRIVLMALRKEPERRYSSAEQIAEDLERYLGGLPVRARRDTIGYRAQRFVQRNRLAVGAAALVLASLCAGLYGSWRARLQAEAALEVARVEQQRALAAAGHARIETESFQLIAEFLGDTLLLGVDDDRKREDVGRQVARQATLVRNLYAERPHLRANLVDALGRVYVQLGKLDEAEGLLLEARATRIASFGEETMEHALSLGSLGRLAFERGAFSQAAELLGQAVDLHRAFPEDVHSDIPGALNDLASALRNLGRLEEAAALHSEALGLRRSATPAAPLAVAESLNNMAIVLLDQGQAEAARPLAEEALAIRERLLGPEHPASLQARTSLSGVEWRLGNLDAVEAHLRAAVDGYRAMGELDRGELPRALASLAVLQIGRGDLDAAASTAQEALDRTRERHGAEHPLTASAQAHVAAIHAQRGEHAAARDVWLEVLRVRRAVYPEGHVLLAQTLHHLGIVLVQGGTPEAAGPYLREASTILEAAEDSPALAAERASLELTLGAWAMSLDRREEARTHLERARDEFTRLQGPDSAGAESARGYLVRLSD